MTMLFVNCAYFKCLFIIIIIIIIMYRVLPCLVKPKKDTKIIDGYTTLPGNITTYAEIKKRTEM